MKTHNNADLLTLANLDQHNRSITQLDNNQSIIGLIKQEATQDYERAHWQEYHSTSSSSSSNCPFCQAGALRPSIDKLSRLYPPLEPSKDPPMERFGVLSTANDPVPFITRVEIENAGLTHASLETIEIRRNAAAAVAETTSFAAIEADSDDGSDTRPQEMPAEIRQEYRRAGSRPSVSLR